MRKLHVACLLVCVSTLAACKAKDPAPTAPEVVATGAPAAPPATGGTPTVAPSTAPPAFVVYTGFTGELRTVGATIEDGSAGQVSLSSPQVDTTFAGVISGRRALLVEYKADKSIDALVSVRGDGTSRTSLGSLPPGKYAAIKQVRSVDDVVIIEASRVGSELTTDVFTLRAGASADPTRLLSADSTLVAAEANRVAVMTAGNLRSLTLDGSTTTPLGGRDGRDRVAEVKGARILLTMHAGTSGDVRSIGIDGSGAVDLGKPGLDETAFASTSAARIVFVRKSAEGVTLVSALSKDEQVLTAPAADLTPIQVTADGDVLFQAAGAMLAVSLNGGNPRVLDPAVGTNVQIGAVQGGLVVYRSDSANGPALRAAKLDGTSQKSLCEGAPQIPFFGGMTSTGRVVYYRALAGQQEGGRLFSIKVDGTDRRPVGTVVAGADGKPMAIADQDFEARTPQGRLIFESEFLANGGPQLVIASQDAESAKLLAGASHVRFAALIP